VNAADEAEEGISDRGKPRPSRGAVKAISILRATTQAVLQRRKRDPEGDGVSETKSCTERDHVAFTRGKTPAKARAGDNPASLPHGPSKRVQHVVKRRTLRSHHGL